MVTPKTFFYAYSENFKGAPNGWHQLRKINFLVGENSTGKSSFQQLYKIVSHQAFVYTLDALGIIPTISSPADIIGRLSKSPHVAIGFAANIELHPDDDLRFYARIATYFDLEGTLTVAAVTFVNPEYVLTVYRDSKSFYRYSKSTEYSAQDLASNPEAIESIHHRIFTNEEGELLGDEDYGFESDGWYSATLLAARRIGASKYPNPMQMPQVFKGLSYGPSRRAPQRLLHGDKTRFNSTGAHAPFLFKDVLQHVPEMEEKLKGYGVASGLFDSVSIEEISTKAGDRPFLITVGKSGKSFYVDELGYGVSQILPVVIDILVVDSDYTIFVQQPELHLHPRAQAEFGSFMHANASDGPSLVIETHSDFVIDRFRVEQSRAAPDRKLDAQVLFFSSDADSGLNQLSRMKIEDDGSFSSIPDGYRDFFMDENMMILGAL